MAKVNQDPFSNGEDFRWWSARNCDKCIKSPKMVVSDLIAYTKSQRTIDICRKNDCPFRKEHWPVRKHRRKSKTANQPSLFEEV